MDAIEHPEKYKNKTLRFKAIVYHPDEFPPEWIVPGRFAMTCCVDDIQFCGIPCRYDKPQELESRSWVMVTAKVTAEKHKLYKGDVGPVLTAIRVVKDAEPAIPDVCTF